MKKENQLRKLYKNKTTSTKRNQTLITQNKPIHLSYFCCFRVDTRRLRVKLLERSLNRFAQRFHLSNDEIANDATIFFLSLSEQRHRRIVHLSHHSSPPVSLLTLLSMAVYTSYLSFINYALNHYPVGATL